jgi:hypothetical protein
VGVCDNVPLVPVTVTVVGPPAVALDNAVNVSVALVPGVIVLELNDAVTPLGIPLATKFTEPLNPFNALVLIVTGVLLPTATVALVGAAVKVKSGTVTSRSTFAVSVSEPLVPLIVRVEVLAELPAGILTVRVEVPDVLTEAGENDAVAADGRPLTDKSTPLVNEPSALTVMV